MAAALALLSGVLWGTSDFLGGLASRRILVSRVLGASQLVALIGLVPVAALTGELGAPRTYLLPGVVSGLVGMIALAAFYRALATGTMGIVAPVASLGVVVPIVVGLAGGDSPSGLQLVGMCAAVAGVVLASGPELSSGSAGGTPLVLAACAAVGFGLVLTVIARGSDAGSAVMLLLTMRVTSVTVLTALFFVGPRRRGERLGIGRDDVPILVATGAGDVLANGAYAVAAQSALVSVTAVLGSLYPVVTALLARQVLHERLRPIQIAGVGIALGGVALLAGG